MSIYRLEFVCWNPLINWLKSQNTWQKQLNMPETRFHPWTGMRYVISHPPVPPTKITDTTHSKSLLCFPSDGWTLLPSLASLFTRAEIHILSEKSLRHFSHWRLKWLPALDTFAMGCSTTVLPSLLVSARTYRLKLSTTSNKLNEIKYTSESRSLLFCIFLKGWSMLDGFLRVLSTRVLGLR